MAEPWRCDGLFRGLASSWSRRHAGALLFGIMAGRACDLPQGQEVAARSCPPCRKKKNGKCRKKKPDGAACGACRECRRGRCNSLCGSNEGCVGGACLDFGGTCSGTDDFCESGQVVSCTFNGAGGRCIRTDEGASFCASSVSCDVCQSDADCRGRVAGGPHDRCIAACAFCSGASACVTLADEDQ